MLSNHIRNNNGDDDNHSHNHDHDHNHDDDDEDAVRAVGLRFADSTKHIAQPNRKSSAGFHGKGSRMRDAEPSAPNQILLPYVPCPKP